MFRVTLATLVLVAHTLYSGCGLDPLLGEKEKNKAENEDTGNLVEGIFGAGNTEAVNLSAPDGSEVAGANILFPAGALKLDTKISIGEGASIANDATAAELGITGNTVTSAGPAVVFDSSADFNADENNPFVLQLPVTGSGSLHLLACTNIIVVYKQKRALDGGGFDLYVGLIRKDKIEVGADHIKVSTRYFGAYQAACSEKELTTDVEPVKTEVPIVQKIASAPHIGSWARECYIEQKNNGGSRQLTQDNSDPFKQQVDFFDQNDAKAAQIVRDLGLTPEYMAAIAALRSDGVNNDLESQRDFFTLTKDRFVFRGVQYFGANCELEASSTTISGPYRLGGNVSDFENTKEIDAKFETERLRVSALSYAAYFRYFEFCGVTDWGPDKIVDITAEKCPNIYDRIGDDGGDGASGVGSEVKSIIQVLGDELRLGTKDENDPNRENNSVRDNKLEDKFFKRL